MELNKIKANLEIGLSEAESRGIPEIANPLKIALAEVVNHQLKEMARVVNYRQRKKTGQVNATVNHVHQLNSDTMTCTCGKTMEQVWAEHVADHSAHQAARKAAKAAPTVIVDENVTAEPVYEPISVPVQKPVAPVNDDELAELEKAFAAPAQNSVDPQGDPLDDLMLLEV